METVRLRKIQAPSQLERLLVAFATRVSGLLPDDCYQVRNPLALPPQLQRVLAGEAVHNGRTWACWADNFRAWLFTCEMSLIRSRERGMPVLQISIFDEVGGLINAGTWVHAREGTWHRCNE